MKKLNYIDKIIYLLNSVFAAVLLLSYVLPFVAPKTFSVLSVLSLSVPVLLVANAVFVLYWLLKVKKQLLLSLVVLSIGYKNVSALYKFSSDVQVEKTAQSLSVLSYNVRLFNLYGWLPVKNIASKITKFVQKENPDIIAFQEFHPNKKLKLAQYPYQYQSLSKGKVKYGQAIYSKFKIINKGDILFKKTHNKAIFIDIIKAKDTLRIYNVHFESLHINPSVEELKDADKELLVKRIGHRFVLQQNQARQVLVHQQKCKYKKIVLGDFNNTAYSYIYKQFKNSDFKDAFEMAGNGFGKTFNFKFFPLRIDFILIDKKLSTRKFKNYNYKYSDHYPIKAEIVW